MYNFDAILYLQVFDLMKKQVPDYLDKISVLIGDCSLPNMGIEKQYEEILINEVN